MENKTLTDTGVEFNRTHEKQKVAESKLHDIQEFKTKTEAELKSEQDHLEKAKSSYYKMKNQSRQAKALGRICFSVDAVLASCTKTDVLVSFLFTQISKYLIIKLLNVLMFKLIT